MSLWQQFDLQITQNNPSHAQQVKHIKSLSFKISSSIILLIIQQEELGIKISFEKLKPVDFLSSMYIQFTLPKWQSSKKCFFTFDMFGPIEFNLLSNKHQHDLTSSYASYVEFNELKWIQRIETFQLKHRKLFDDNNFDNANYLYRTLKIIRLQFFKRNRDPKSFLLNNKQNN
ncbi:hypothetical protein pb186bvf_002879 [Paramecium bursaria]